MTDGDDRAGFLREVWLFAGCTDDELEHIASLTTARSAGPGEAICTQGEPGSEFFVLVQGTADAQVDGSTVASLEAGACFGEMALIDGGDRSASIIATSPSELFVLDRAAFTDMMSTTMPHVAPRMFQVMGQHIRDLAIRGGQPLPF
jgi:CRP-like cAMP-binding protein